MARLGKKILVEFYLVSEKKKKNFLKFLFIALVTIIEDTELSQLY